MDPKKNDIIAPSELTPRPGDDIELASIPATIPVTKTIDPFLVEFDATYDAENPKHWPTGHKWAVTDVLSATGFIRIMVSTIMAPALSTIAHEFNMSSTESAMALSIYLLATAFGPVFIGPLSEIYGRKRVLHASNIWFLIWNIACGFANSKELLIASRFLAGFGASSIYALAGGVLGDVWMPEQRGHSLGIYLLIPLLAVAVGPIIGGFMAFRTTWRWMFWSTSIFQAVMIVVSFTVFRETYAPLILSRRAEKLRRETGNSQYYTADERLDGEKTVLARLGQALSRPLRLLAFHPIIQVTSILSAFYYGILYIVLSSFSELWIQEYNYTAEISGLHYIACALGELVGSQIGAQLMDFFYRRKLARSSESGVVPESRIPLVFFGALFSALGLFVYGWTAQYHVHWIAVDIAIFIQMLGSQIAGMPMMAYVIDVYPNHTSSAMAATQFLKSLTAFLFPLFAPSMYRAIGYGWGNTTMAFIGLFLGVPAPMIIWKFGTRLRAKATSSY
ncbi:putative efflux pump antibiotic resistance protein [Melanomma pulvis-pyrius CBS 109.77]|uniref:Putative efflux pump antibiotic resistance protein n=1 Tax=Melanomma pulvis-pyrius CBS 109.77 TaxID=1314802 RepID=A0A6A6XX62_9PLEO|nr:putative efflux pump antibiotic resistance protein [Melanomma pulvis-pyrius CBS 109.77]